MHNQSNQKFDVFLSHNSKDKPSVQVIASKLESLNLSPWLDAHQIKGGKIFIDEIEKAIKETKVAAIILSKNGLGRWQKKEIEALLDKSAHETIGIIPVLLPGLHDIPDTIPSALFLKNYQWVKFDHTIDDYNINILASAIRSSLGITETKQTVKPPRHPLSLIYTWIISRWIIIGTGVATLAAIIFLTLHSPQDNSSKSAQYVDLSNLLAAGKWRDADDATSSLMLEIASREKDGWLDYTACSNFPKDALLTIDQLWLKYSNNRFGFSVQKKIWEKYGGKLDGNYDYDTYVKLAEEVGWRKGGTSLKPDELTFNKNAPTGHLPATLLEDVKDGEDSCLLSRL